MPTLPTNPTIFAAAYAGALAGMTASGRYVSSPPADENPAIQYAGTAAANFPCAGGLRINGASTAYAIATVAGVATVYGGVPLTAANLDAPAGPTGFAGLAFWPGQTGGYAGNGAQP